MKLLKRILGRFLDRSSTPATKPDPEPPVDAYDHILIPREHRERFVKLVDARLADKSDGRLTSFRLWDFVETILPEIGLGWSVYWFSATQPALRRLKSEAPKLASPAVMTGLPSGEAIETGGTSTLEPSVTVVAVALSKEAGSGDTTMTVR